MKRHWLSLILAALLLTGCAAQPDADTLTTEPVQVTPAEPTGYYDPASGLEESSGGAVRQYPLNRMDSMAVLPMGDDLLLISGLESTTLSRLTGSNLYVSAAANLDCFIDPASPAVSCSEKGVTYYDEARRELIFLDASLKEVNRVSLPEGIIGQPGLTGDRKLLYYCTADALRCIDLETGLDKLLREMAYSYQALTGLHCGDTVIECTIEDENANWFNLYINPQTGETLCQTAGDDRLWTYDDTYFTVHYDGAYPELLTGTVGETPAMLLQENYDADPKPVLNCNGVVLVCAEGDATSLQFYDLSSGQRTAFLELPGSVYPWSIQSAAGSECVWFLGFDDTYGCDVLYRWDLSKTATQDDTVYLTARRTASTPDTEGLAECAQLAQTIGEKHGVEILTWTDATAYEPWDYTLEAEYQVPLIRENLQLLDEILANYPEGFLAELGRSTSSGKVRLCLVRAITGNPDANVLSAAQGLQYWDDSGNAYVSVTMGTQMQQSVYHELFHIIESRVMSKCDAYDNWNDLNPEGFAYDYDYTANLQRSAEDWLDGDDRAFIDTYSMSYPKEDRARIMEYAMAAGNKGYFTSDTMQAKLRQLCLGIREAFDLEDSTESYPWEQYLH